MLSLFTRHMRPHGPARLKAGLFAFFCSVAPLSYADCSRVIQVPAASTGYSFIIKGDAISGVYPDVLRHVGKPLHCEFRFPPVPRARLEQMFFKAGEADILIPASRSPERDAFAEFFPLIRVQPALISLKSRALAVVSLEQLKSQTSLRGAVVRGYTYGAEYQALLAELDQQNRIDYVPSLSNVVAMLKVGHVDFTILSPTLFYSTAMTEAETAELPNLMAYSSLEGLDAIESGAYLSTKSLNHQDLELMRKALTNAKKSGVLWSTFEKYYPAVILKPFVSRLKE